MPNEFSATNVEENPHPQRLEPEASELKSMNRHANFDRSTRAQVLAYKIIKLSNAKIEELTGLKKTTIDAIFAKAKKRGFDPSSPQPRILDRYVEDGTRSGRPLKNTEDLKEAILSRVRTDRYGREKSCAYIASELGGIVSPTIVWQVLRSAGYRKTKPTRKPGLTKRMRDERLAWCLAYKDWTLEDWKRVIWTDETSVILGLRRGGYRVWRLPDEVYNKSCVRPRWKNASEFMFWGSFSYDFKGPCHIWQPETPAEKKASKQHLEDLNKQLEPVMKAEWELTTGMRRTGLRNLGGTKPKWRWDAKHGKLEREIAKGGIDWYRYQTVVVQPKLIPFAKECEKKRKGMIIQEDKAPCHAAKASLYFYSLHDVERMTWVGNSPDLNMIEPAWVYLKRATTKYGCPSNKAEAKEAWLKAWQDLEQWRIQKWIERILNNVQEVIRLEGGNEYKEGKCKNLRRFQAPIPDEHEPNWEYTGEVITAKDQLGSDLAAPQTSAEIRMWLRSEDVRRSDGSDPHSSSDSEPD